MDGFKAYKYFIAIKLHFTSERYDVFETNGRVSGSREAFERRNDRGLFEKLAKKFSSDQELIQFLVANVAYGHMNVVYSCESEEYYALWKRRKESISRVFEVDLHTIAEYLRFNNATIDDLYSIDDKDGTPLLLKLYIGKHITLETMAILQDIDNYLPNWQSLIMLWHDHFLTVRKVKRFVKYDKSRIQYLYGVFKENLAG